MAYAITSLLEHPVGNKGDKENINQNE